MIKFIMLMGLPASGKSTYARELSLEHDAVIMSSDALRLEMFGSMENQEQNGKLFEELNRRTISALKNGKNVVYDATNISIRRRKSLIERINKTNIQIEKTCIMMYEPIESCVTRDKKRDRKVGREVIERMYSTFEVPTLFEGWDIISIKYDEYFRKSMKCNLLLSGNNLGDIYDITKPTEDIEIFNSRLEIIPDGINCIDLGQDNPHHTLSVNRHMFEAFKEVCKYTGDTYDGAVLRMASMYHDVGKAYCKFFKEGEKYAHFYNHENVSAYLALGLGAIMDSGTAISVSNLILYHMRLHDPNLNVEKLINNTDKKFYSKLAILEMADSKAK